MILVISKQYSSQTRVSSSDNIGAGTLDDVRRWLERKQVFGLDTETTGLSYLDDRILFIQIGDAKTQFVIDVRDGIDEIINVIKPFLEDETKQKILHNAKFDYKFLRKAGIRLRNIYDTFVIEDLLTKGYNSKLSYDKVVERRLNKILPVQKNYRLEFTKPGFYLTEEAIQYSAADVEYFIPLRAAQIAQLKVKNELLVGKLECKVTQVLAEIEYQGMELDKDAWLKLAAEKKIELIETRNALDQHILTDEKFKQFRGGYQLDMFDENVRKIGINWGSSKQVLSVFKVIDSELDSVDGSKLTHLTAPIIKDYLEYKHMLKLTNAYGVDFLSTLGSDGKIHTNFRQMVNTGRISSSSPNMHQIPSTSEYRNCFIPPKDYVFVSADYSSQELALIAWGSQDPVWLKALEEGKDLHSVCAELVFDSDWAAAMEEGCAYYEEQENNEGNSNVQTITYKQSKCTCKGHVKLRTAVKAINFGLSYGMGASKLAYKLKITKQDAEDLIEKYFKTFPNIKAFLERSAYEATTNGYIATLPPFKRRRYFPGFKTASNEYYASIERAGKNTKIQGSGADMIKQAMVMVDEYIYKNTPPVTIVMNVHDELNTVCHKDYAVTWKNKLEELMEYAATFIIPTGILKAKAEITIVWEK